jgi:hypothetical protein
VDLVLVTSVNVVLFSGVAEGFIAQAAWGVICNGLRSEVFSAGSAKASIYM